MIPKIVHYCWFGRHPLPEEALRCIASWKKYLPGYEIREWNEENFDIGSIPYTQEAYEEKKYAFVSDYARFWILYRYGGIYFDTDVEVVRPLDPILSAGAFMGCELGGTVRQTGVAVAPGLGIATAPGTPVYRELLDLYRELHFRKADGSLDLTTVVKYTTDILKKHGLKNEPGIQRIGDITIYPPEYFCPKSPVTGKITLTENTYCIHHFAATWQSPWQKMKTAVKPLLVRTGFYDGIYRIYSKYLK